MKQRGGSLLELTVALLIVGILAVGVPMYRRHLASGTYRPRPQADFRPQTGDCGVVHDELLTICYFSTC
ncbi:MAG: prepilin-type N-terminal cleavage/methylation domain-containing protein [Candidatus Xenobia bacterium]